MDKFSTIFKAYDVRGVYPEQLDESTASRIGEAFAAVRKPTKVAVGQDVRHSGVKLKQALIDSLLSNGVDVVDIGVITTDQLYFAVGNYKLDGGISVTASHNPAEYNGFKFSEAGGAPISSEDLIALRDWAASGQTYTPARTSKLTQLEIIEDYTEQILSYIDTSAVKPLHILANANFGAVGRAVDRLAVRLNLKLDRLNWEEDGSFPKGPPNPLLPENRHETIARIGELKPDFAVAWDADADRCFFFTGEGEFISSSYIIALLSQEFLKKYPGSKIVHDATTAWVIDDYIKAAGGIPAVNRTGHTFIKARMRQEDAPFGGESSGHYYFRDSFYADNGIVPFLMVLELVSKTGKTLHELVKPMMDKYKVSGEINFKTDDPTQAIAAIRDKFGKKGKIEEVDGLIISTPEWRFNVRPSNTEPLFRLNAEAYDQTILDNLVKEISSLIK